MPIQARKQGHLIYTVDWSSGLLSPVGGGGEGIALSDIVQRHVQFVILRVLEAARA